MNRLHKVSVTLLPVLCLISESQAWFVRSRDLQSDENDDLDPCIVWPNMEGYMIHRTDRSGECRSICTNAVRNFFLVDTDWENGKCEVCPDTEDCTTDDNEIGKWVNKQCYEKMCVSDTEAAINEGWECGSCGFTACIESEDCTTSDGLPGKWMNQDCEEHKCLAIPEVALKNGWECGKCISSTCVETPQSNCNVPNGILPDLPSAAFGVHGWASWRPSVLNKENAPNAKGGPIIMHWDELEREEGVYNFDRVLGERLVEAEKNDFYCMLKVWVWPNRPAWLFEKGIPIVQMEGQNEDSIRFLYPFDETYLQLFFNLIENLAHYVDNLPDNLRKRILFIQSAEGCTGDPYVYKGRPVDPKYEITRDDWSKFKTKVWSFFKTHFQDNAKTPLMLLINYSEEEWEREWILKNMNTFATKRGFFSDGYHTCYEKQRYDEWQALVAEAENRGLATYSRGEADGDIPNNWGAANMPLAMYWSGIFATHNGLDQWNVPANLCVNETLQDALIFFNKYAGQRNPSVAKGAFCALHKALDASDLEMYPIDKYGYVENPARYNPWKDQQRYIDIAAEYAKYGATMEDPEAATGDPIITRRRKGRNDAGWGIITGNYERFLTQIDPENTSVAWWNVGPTVGADSIYGRFARGFEYESGKKQMIFKLDDRFFGDDEPHTVKVTVTYLDKGNGQWTLKYFDGSALTGTTTKTCLNSGTWKTEVFEIDGAVFNGSFGGGDITLTYVRGDNTIFHMIELAR